MDIFHTNRREIALVRGGAHPCPNPDNQDVCNVVMGGGMDTLGRIRTNPVLFGKARNTISPDTYYSLYCTVFAHLIRTVKDDVCCPVLPWRQKRCASFTIA